MNLNRTEELEIKKDIKGIRKAIEALTEYFGPPAPPKGVVSDPSVDPFFGKIHMSQAHMNAWDAEFDATCLALVGLMEECAELQQASSKYYRKYRDFDQTFCGEDRTKIIEEMAHVLIDIRMVCEELAITPDEIQQEIYKKYPDGYDLTAMMDDFGPVYYVERRE